MGIGYIIRQVIAALLVPVCFAAAFAFGDLMLDQGDGGPAVNGIHAGLALIVGAAVYSAIYIFMHRSIFRAVFDRGSVQTMWGTITGYHLPDVAKQGKQAEVPVDAKGRRVPLWASMAPYAFPIYTILGVLGVWLIKYFFSMSVAYYAVIQAAVIGFTYASHLFVVGDDIRTRQPALRSAGTFFTLVVMFLFNVELLALVAMLVFDANWLDFNIQIFDSLYGEYEWFWDRVSSLLS
jgi:hypothetical protein